MELVYLVMLLAALIVMNWRFVGLDRLFKSRRGPGEPPSRMSGACPWRRSALRPSDSQTRWFCASCGVEAYGDAPPTRCQRAMRDIG